MAYELDWDRGIANVGDTSRIRAVMERAKRGEAITLGFLGGSITQGSLSSAPERCYAHLVYDWWEREFPNATFSYVNAGIGGTTSQFGAARAKSDLLDREPDFVIIEFSVNDESTPHFMETYEGLVRQVYGAPFAPAVLLVHNVFYDTGGNAQLVHGRIGRHYGIPSVSMQGAIWPEVASGRIDNRAITPDDLHPNDEGHALVASVITHFLGRIASGSIDGGKSVEFSETKKELLPEPLTKNAYEDSVRYQNDSACAKCAGFSPDTSEQSDITDCFKKGWTASEEGDSITFTARGSCLSVQYRKSVRHPAPVAIAIVDGDEGGAVRLDANFDEDWGDKLELDTILEHGNPGEHRVEVRVAEAHEDDATPFYLVSLIASGGTRG